ncbi:MAG: amidase [Niastella sp. SCN 39-18]|nr:CHAP domain-containing protein [Sphingobacteriales bacterium]ODT55180.1 MAG: amidase [Niastella sp. SCN 39-18]OJW09108.1 MAG: amidase [Sphingobacteriales bacterium 39-19]
MEPTLSQRSLCIAASQEGVSERPKNSNSGPEVNQYLKSIGLGPGYSWCMAFVYWCVNKAAAEMSIKNPLIKTGGVLRQWNETSCRKIPKTSRAVKPGDIFIMEFSKGRGHTGFVAKVEGSLVHTIEGNTNDDGSREGYEVAKRVRTISGMKGFIQLT